MLSNSNFFPIKTLGKIFLVDNAQHKVLKLLYAHKKLPDILCKVKLWLHCSIRSDKVMAKVYDFALYGGGKYMAKATVFDVAKSFLTLESMTHKKLQKLCYYAQAWNWALENEALFDADFQAWIHGPVCPQLYDVYKIYGWQNIPLETGTPNLSTCDYESIEQIYRIYGQLDGDDLERLTHSELPWQSARKGLRPNEPSVEIIDPSVMREFYLKEFERSQND